MCILCSELWSEAHWAEMVDASDARSNQPSSLELHADERGRRLRDRQRRVAVANKLLESVGLHLQDWEGASYLLRDRKGSSLVVPGLGGLWQAVETLIGRPLDPLDPADLARMLGADPVRDR